jgi:hypothetical protein
VPHGALKPFTASGASTGAGGAEHSQAERNTERSGVFLALETKFLLFWAGQEQDSVPSRSSAPGFNRPWSLGPTRSTLSTPRVSTPARASAPRTAFVFFRPPKYLEPCPSPRERHGNTKTAQLLGHGPVSGRVGFLGLLSGRGWGLSPPGSRQGYGSIGKQPASIRADHA